MINFNFHQSFCTILEKGDNKTLDTINPSVGSLIILRVWPDAVGNYAVLDKSTSGQRVVDDKFVEIR